MTCKECKDKYEVTRPFKVLSEGHARVEHWGHTPDIHINVKTRLAGGADACLKCLLWRRYRKMKMLNQDISNKELKIIRKLGNFDLKMLLSEIHDHGWPEAKITLKFIVDAGKKNNVN